MNETRFLKTVTFGGYDKTDTDELIKSLYNRISHLESELRVTKFSLERCQNDSETKQDFQSFLDGEHEKFIEIQSQNETLSLQLQSALAENSDKEKEITELKNSIAELESNLADADIRLSSMSEKDDVAVFGAVFAAAKKTASEIIENANKKSADLDANSKKLAENIVAEANNKAADIVYEAELYASEMTAEVDESLLKTTSSNIKSEVLDDVNELSGKISRLKQVFEELKNYGDEMIQKTENTLTETQSTLIKGGIPVFQNTEISSHISLPEKPVYQNTDYSYNGAESENKFDDYEYDYDENTPNFEDLEEVDILGDDEDDFDLSGLVRNASPTKKSGVNFEALDKQAEEFIGRKKPNLNDILAQAEALEDNAPKKKKSGGIDLAALTAQAEALDD